MFININNNYNNYILGSIPIRDLEILGVEDDDVEKTKVSKPIPIQDVVVKNRVISAFMSTRKSTSGTT